MPWTNRSLVAFGIDSSSLSVVVWCLAMRWRLMGKIFEELEVFVGEDNRLWKEQPN